MDLEKELSLHLPLSSFEEERGSRGHGRPWGERTEGKVNGSGGTSVSMAAEKRNLGIGLQPQVWITGASGVKGSF